MEDVSCRRNHGAGILHGGGIMEDASGGHLGRIWRRPGCTQEAPRDTLLTKMQTFTGNANCTWVFESQITKHWKLE